jgi:hypothetical protein
MKRLFLSLATAAFIFTAGINTNAQERPHQEREPQEQQDQEFDQQDQDQEFDQQQDDQQFDRDEPTPQQQEQRDFQDDQMQQDEEGMEDQGQGHQGERAPGQTIQNQEGQQQQQDEGPGQDGQQQQQDEGLEQNGQQQQQQQDDDQEMDIEEELGLQEDEDVPENIRNEFNKRYPLAEDPQWESAQLDQEGYEVTFESGGREFRSFFSEDGRWLRTENDVEAEELPTQVRSSMQQEVDDLEEADIQAYDTPQGRFYKANDEHYFDARGQLLNPEDEQQEQQEDDQDDDNGLF